MRKTFMYVIVTASALFCGLNLYDSFQQARAKEAFFQSRTDGYCILRPKGKCKNNGWTFADNRNPTDHCTNSTTGAND